MKAPRPGAVKTRLARALGAEEACAAYRRLVDTLLARLRRLSAVDLCYTPRDAMAEIRPWLAPAWQACPQAEGSLGLRLESAFSAAFRSGVRRVVIIGSDCPVVTPGDIEEAWEALRSQDLVLGPSSDGGYWLIGLRRSRPALFHDIPWSTNRVCAATLRRARAAGLRVRLLRQLSDVDTAEQWRQFQVAM